MFSLLKLRVSFGRRRVSLRPTLVGTLATLLGVAFAIVAMSYGHYFFKLPNPTIRTALVPILALVLVRLLIPYCRFVVTQLRGTAWWGIAIASGVVLPAWWWGAFHDASWSFPPATRPIVQALATLAVGVCLTSIYAGLLAVAVRVSPEPSVETTSTPRKWSWGILAGSVGFLLIANTIAYSFVTSERTVYYWDHMVYWMRTTELTRTLNQSPLAAWNAVRQSVPRDDYGLTPALLPAAAMSVFGEGRVAYILSVTNLYLFATALAAAWCVRVFVPCSGRWAYLVPMSLLLTNSAAWVPLLRGYLDIGGVAIAIAILTIALRKSQEHLPLRELLALGALLALLVLFRRWYAYFAVAFFVMMALDAVIAMLQKREPITLVLLVQTARPLVVIVGVMVVLLWSFAAPWVRTVATTNYAEAYAAYKSSGTMLVRLYTAIDFTGLAYVLFAVVGALLALRARELRRPVLIVGGLSGVTAFLFLRTQDLNPHHCYLFLPAMLLLPSWGLTHAMRNWSMMPRLCLLAVVASASSLVMLAMLVPKAYEYRDLFRPFVPNYVVHPAVRGDLDELRRLLCDLETNTTPTSRIAVVGSSPTFNPFVLSMAEQSWNQPQTLTPRFVAVPEVDRVSTFPLSVCEADIVVVGDPPQTHLRPEEQQVVVLLANRLTKREGLGRAFKPTADRYTLDGGVNVCVYRRVRVVSREEMQELADQLRIAHPRWPSLWTIPEQHADHSARR